MKTYAEGARQLMPAHPYGKGYMIINEEGIDELLLRIADKHIGMQSIRVLLLMMKSCEMHNRCMIGQKEIVDKLGMKPSAVSRSIADLLGCGILERPTSIRGLYAINPAFAWRGSTNTLRLERSKRAAAQRRDHTGSAL
jgi:hypothetical protein